MATLKQQPANTQRQTVVQDEQVALVLSVVLICPDGCWQLTGVRMKQHLVTLFELLDAW